MQSLSSPKAPVESALDERIPEARYAYYRRCEVFRRNGAQCKAPAEKGSSICYAHAGQLAMAVRRERERRAMLAEAVGEMRRQGKPECEMADLFTDFKGIQVTLAVMARAVIKGTIDCKTAGQMVVHLQTISKLLWQIHRKGRKDLPLIHTDTTDLNKLPKAKALPRFNADDAGLTSRKHAEKQDLPQIYADERRLKRENWAVGLYVRRAPDYDPKVLSFELMTFGDQCRAHSPPESKAA